MSTTGEPLVEVGGYRLLGLLGEGGMGVVHLAEGRDGNRVALKLLRPHVVGDEQARRRFAQEVSSLSRVRSDRVAEIVDADPWGPAPFVATRYVAGPSLTDHVRRHGPLDERALRRFAAGLAEALAAVHRVGVLHRDVKPGNVLVEGADPVLIDFGLARMVEDPHLTATGWLLGTPGYLAPEILYGEEPGPAADVHAWAATVGYAATGHPPAGRGPAMAILDRVRRGEFDLTGVPAGLLPILEQALAPEPADRPTVATLLRRLGAHQPPAPADEPTLQLDRTRVLAADPVHGWTADPGPVAPASAVSGPAPPAEQPWSAPWPDPRVAPAPPRRGRQRLGLFGLGVAGAALTAAAPYLGLVLLALVAAVLRFVSVTAERHRQRRLLRGRARWYDVPASAVASPGYLVYSLAGTLLLLAWALATVVALGLVLTGLGVAVPSGLAVVGAGYVLALWWGPASARVRSAARDLTVPLARATRTGPVLGAIGLVAAVVLLGLLDANGPVWTPATHAPWSGGWAAQVRDALR